MKSKKVIFVIVAAVVLVVAVAALSSSKAKKYRSTASGGAPWYAVHLTNGSVYFGHPAAITPDTITLADTYYLEVYTAPADQPAAVATSTSFEIRQNAPKQIYNITRRGASDNMPTDNVLFIDRRSVLFWERLGADSEMTKWLNQAGQK